MDIYGMMQNTIQDKNTITKEEAIRFVKEYKPKKVNDANDAKAMAAREAIRMLKLDQLLPSWCYSKSTFESGIVKHLDVLYTCFNGNLEPLYKFLDDVRS